MRGGRIQVFDLSHNFPEKENFAKDPKTNSEIDKLNHQPDFSGQLVVQSIVFPLLDAVPPHDLYLMQIVAHLIMHENISQIIITCCAPNLFLTF